MEVVSGDNWTMGAMSCKAPVKLSPPTNHHPVFLQAGCPSWRPTNSVKALKGKYHTPWTCLPQAHMGVFQLCLWSLIAPGYLGGGLPCLSSAIWGQNRGKLKTEGSARPSVHAHLLAGISRRDHITPILRQLHWLPVRRRVDFKIAVLVFQCLTG